MFTKTIKADLIEYLSETPLKDVVDVYEGYTYGKERKAHEIDIILMDDNTSAEHETLCLGETVRYMPLQFSIYSTQLRINGDLMTARDSVDYIAEYVRKFMNIEAIKNGEIKSCRRTSKSTTLPLNDIGADTYFTAYRYRILAQPID